MLWKALNFCRCVEFSKISRRLYMWHTVWKPWIRATLYCFYFWVWSKFIQAWRPKNTKNLSVIELVTNLSGVKTLTNCYFKYWKTWMYISSNIKVDISLALSYFKCLNFKNFALLSQIFIFQKFSSIIDNLKFLHFKNFESLPHFYISKISDRCQIFTL
jgi:hypothetical protein